MQITRARFKTVITLSIITNRTLIVLVRLRKGVPQTGYGLNLHLVEIQNYLLIIFLSWYPTAYFLLFINSSLLVNFTIRRRADLTVFSITIAKNKKQYSLQSKTISASSITIFLNSFYQYFI